MQLKNKLRMLRNVSLVVKELTVTLDENYFPVVDELRPGPKRICPDSDIICIAWFLEIIGKDSELAGYKIVKAELSNLFQHLSECFRFKMKSIRIAITPLRCRVRGRPCVSRGNPLAVVEMLYIFHIR